MNDERNANFCIHRSSFIVHRSIPPLTEPATKAGRRRHWEMFIIALIAISLSFVLTIHEDGRVAMRGLDKHAAPESCLSHSLFGISCPGCGLTRSFIRLAQGDLHGSLHYHRLGWMMAAAVLIQLPYRAVGLHSNRILARRPATLVGIAIIAALIGNWLLLMIM